MITRVFLFICLSVDTIARQSLTMKVSSAVKHPDYDDAILAIIRDGQVVEVFIEGSTYNTLTSTTPGYLDGHLSDSQFKWPSSIIELSAGRYAVSDTGNHCIRVIDWESKTVSELTGNCGDSNDFNKPRYMVRDRRADTFYVTFFNDDCNNKVVRMDLNGGSRKWIYPGIDDNDYCFAGIAMSLYHDMLYILVGKLIGGTNSRRFDKVGIATIDTEQFSSINFDDKKLVNATEHADEVTLSGSITVYSSKHMNYREFGLSQVGNYLVAIMGKGSPFLVFDFSNDDMSIIVINMQNVSVTDNRYDESKSIGPLIYTDNPYDPGHVYTWYDDRFQQFEQIDRCMVKSQARPFIWSSTWIRSPSHSCPYGNSNQIGPGQAFDNNNIGDVCQRRFCYSTCKERCEIEDSCVAFQCDSVTQMCHIYNCSAAPTEFNRQHACYRMADVVVAPLNL